MKKARKLFGEFNMTWPKVIIFAVITAVVTAGLKLIPFLNDTSFQDIAIYADCWLLFALFIVANCGKWWEAMLKCFVFFVISQPLIYLFQVPFSYLGWGLFMYYRYWGIVTLFTLPAAVLAFFIRKQNWAGAVILSVAAGLLAYDAFTYLASVVKKFPYHLISLVFCILLIVFLAFVLLDKMKHRILVFIAAAVVFAVFAITSFAGVSGNKKAVVWLLDGNWSYTVDDGSICEIQIEDGNHVTVSPLSDGETTIYFTGGNGETAVYLLDVINGKAQLTDITP